MMGRMTAGRSRDLFDSGWKFFRGELHVPHSVKAGMLGGLADAVKRKGGKHLVVAFVDQELKKATDPEKWPTVSLPHDFVVEGKPDPRETDHSHGFLPRGIGYYRKVFTLPKTDLGRKIVLEFDGIFRDSTVWVNGHHLADHRSGYTSFQVDLTDVARYGDEGPNTVLVRVDARQSEGWWYEGGGIYRHVWLRKTDRLHIRNWGTYVTTPKVSASSADVKIETEIRNERKEAVTAVLESVIVDRKGRKVGRNRTKVVLRGDSGLTVRQRLTVRKPLLWSLSAPDLYRLFSSLYVSGKKIDRYVTSFGIRTIRFDGKEGFFLNGVRTVIRGTCNHQDFAGVGVALPDSLQAYRIKLLQEMGCNAYRCAHHPPTPELLDACDRMGMLVMDENRKLDSSPTGLGDLKRMLYRDRNHPSVILWGMENEEPLEGTPMGARIVDTLARATRRIDPTRPTLSAMNHGDLDGGYAEKMDVKGFNYGHNNDKDVKYHEQRPWHPIVGTETSASVTTRGMYETDATRGILDAYGDTMATPPWPWNIGFDTPWRSVLKHRFLSGIFIWSGFDYRGEPLPYKWPCTTSHYGVMDTCGFPKDAYWYHRAQFKPGEPQLHLMPHWNKPVRKGPVRIRALTNLDRVSLFVNGRAMGSRIVAPGAQVEWTADWAPGELVGIGYRNGIEVKRTVVRSVGPARAIHAEPDRTLIRADGMDAVPVRVSIRDAHGIVHPTACHPVKFRVSGPAKIIGVGNGQCNSHEPDKADRRRAFNGWALVIIQSTGKQGRVSLTATSGGLRPARCAVRAV